MMNRLISTRQNARGEQQVNGKSSNSKICDNSSNSALKIVFVSLLLDLLAFTMILPLLPSLMEHYRKNDNENGLYPWLLSKVEYFRSFFGAPERFNSVLFGGKIFLIQCSLTLL